MDIIKSSFASIRIIHSPTTVFVSHKIRDRSKRLMDADRNTRHFVVVFLFLEISSINGLPFIVVDAKNKIFTCIFITKHLAKHKIQQNMYITQISFVFYCLKRIFNYLCVLKIVISATKYHFEPKYARYTKCNSFEKFSSEDCFRWLQKST